MPEIILSVTPDGMKLEAKGYTGGECLKDLEAVKKELAEKYGIHMEQKDQKLKAEYHTVKEQSKIETRR